VTLSYTPSCIVSPKEKKRKVNINNDLAILPSHNREEEWEVVLQPHDNKRSYQSVAIRVNCIVLQIIILLALP